MDVTSITSTAPALSTPTVYPRFEVDVVLPRNETYNWAEVFPVVLAIQNPENATVLGGDFYIRWIIMSWGAGHHPAGLDVGGDDQNRRWFFSERVTFKDNEPYYLVNTTNVYQWNNGITPFRHDVFELQWSVHWDQGPCPNPHGAHGEIFFTINNDTGITPDIMNVVDECPVFASLTDVVNKTLTKEEQCPGYIPLGPELANPCGAKNNKAKASSISSEIQYWATYTEPVEPWPTYTPRPNGGNVAGKKASVTSVLMLVGLVGFLVAL